jgi:hypothetical protein
MKDWRGITIAVGDTVLYATRGGSWMGMVEGVVESFIDDDSAAKIRIMRRQGGGTTELVTVSSRYMTVANLPEATTLTMLEDKAERERKREELKAKQAACEHRWYVGIGYRQCNECRKYEYGDYYPAGYTGYRYRR